LTFSLVTKILYWPSLLGWRPDDGKPIISERAII
jgi:hypothetical protein